MARTLCAEYMNRILQLVPMLASIVSGFDDDPVPGMY